MNDKIDRELGSIEISVDLTPEKLIHWITGVMNAHNLLDYDNIYFRIHEAYYSGDNHELEIHGTKKKTKEEYLEDLERRKVMLENSLEDIQKLIEDTSG